MRSQNSRTLAAGQQVSLPGLARQRPVSVVTRARLPTNTTANRHAIHRWFNFVAGFAPEFVSQNCDLPPGQTLLDPFAGCGTSLVVAQQLGHRAIGFEPHPFFVRIARAKTAPFPTKARLATIENALIDGVRTSPSVALSPSASEFLGKLFQPKSLGQLLGARRAAREAGLADDDLCFLLLSRVVDMCSKSKTDGIYKAPTSTKKAELPLDAIRHVMNRVRDDLTQSAERDAVTAASVHQTSSEVMSEIRSGSVDVAITSPPYLNNFDFAEMTRMYLYFWGICSSWREITELVRSKLIVNTTTALTGHRELQSTYRNGVAKSLRPELDRIVAALERERRVRAGKKEYDLLIYPYIAQMNRVLLETLRCLRSGGVAHIVVSDAAFYGVHVSTPQFLSTTMAEMGYVSVECVKLRDRGHRWNLNKRDGSPTGLGEYHISAAKSI